jgi:hypothetical protein
MIAPSTLGAAARRLAMPPRLVVPPLYAGRAVGMVIFFARLLPKW